MKGLLYKDNRTILTSYKKNAILVVILYTAMAILLEMNFMFFALVFLCGMYTLSSLSFDEYSRWDTYARTLPIPPDAIVGAKYLLGLLWMLGGFGLAMVLATGVDFAKGLAFSTLGANFAGCLAALGVVLFYYALSFPLSYRFGATQARSAVLLVMAALAMAIFGVCVLAEKYSVPNPLGGLETSGEAETILFIAALAVFCLLCYLVSWRISTAIYRHKEF